MKIYKSKALLILGILIITGCNSCPNTKSDFIENLELLERIKTLVIKKTSEKTKKIEAREFQKIVSNSDYKILNELSLDYVYKINDAVIFTFKSPYQQDWLDENFQKNLESCNTHILFSSDENNKKEILAYPQYSECTYLVENINENWTYIFQKWYCAD